MKGLEMVSITLLLLVLALIFTVLSAAGKSQLWIPVLLLVIDALLSHPYFVIR